MGKRTLTLPLLKRVSVSLYLSHSMYVFGIPAGTSTHGVVVSGARCTNNKNAQKH